MVDRRFRPPLPPPTTRALSSSSTDPDLLLSRYRSHAKPSGPQNRRLHARLVQSLALPVTGLALHDALSRGHQPPSPPESSGFESPIPGSSAPTPTPVPGFAHPSTVSPAPPPGFGLQIAGFELSYSALASVVTSVAVSAIAVVFVSQSRPSEPDSTPKVPETTLQIERNPAERPVPAAIAPAQPLANPSPPPPTIAQNYGPDPLLEETRLLQQARQRLRSGDHTGAKRALVQHARRHPEGALVRERRALTIMWSCAASKAAGSSARLASDYLRAHPNDEYSAGIRTACRARSR